MTTTPNTLDQSGTAAAELVRDARALVAGIETGISSAGALFALAAAATIAAMKAHLHTLAAVAALLAVVAFAAVLLGVLFRIALGDPPEGDDQGAASWPDQDPEQFGECVCGAVYPLECVCEPDDDRDHAPTGRLGNPGSGSRNPRYQ
ncbi:hypothetical protein GCM10028784_07190 [Myceligenerans cantabricum]